MLATGCTTVVVLQHKHRTRPSFMLRHPQATCAAVLLCVMPGSREPFHRYLRKGGPIPRYPTIRAHGQYLQHDAPDGGVSVRPQTYRIVVLYWLWYSTGTVYSQSILDSIQKAQDIGLTYYYHDYDRYFTTCNLILTTCYYGTGLFPTGPISLLHLILPHPERLPSICFGP
jgi:hypothetical protein